MFSGKSRIDFLGVTYAEAAVAGEKREKPPIRCIFWVNASSLYLLGICEKRDYYLYTLRIVNDSHKLNYTQGTA